MKQGLRAAINARCADCIGDPCAPASPVVQIEHCPARACPLRAVSPVHDSPPDFHSEHVLEYREGILRAARGSGR